MAFILDDIYQAIEPQSLYAFCVHEKLRTDNWWGQANHFCNPLMIPGIGKLLFSRDQLDSLQLTGSDKFRTLTINDNRPPPPGIALGSSVKVKKVLLVGHEIAVTPGHAQDGNTPYLVTVADPRWLFWDRGKPITANYNVRDDNGAYLKHTLKDGDKTPWTWTQILADLWTNGNLDLLGTAPALPFTPDGTPENLIFRHDYPLNALKYFLDRLACALKYDCFNDTVKIVRLGDTTDASAAAAVTLAAKWKGNLRVDNYQITPQAASYPKTLRIEFPVKQIYSDGTPNVTTLDRTVSPASATFNQAYLSLEDDLTALRPPDAFSNLAALGTRADERQTHWQHKRTNHDTGIYREYGNTIDFTTAIGCYYAAQAWEDRGGERGILTVLASGKNSDRQIEDWRRRVWDDIDAGGADGAGDCCVEKAVLGAICCPPFLGDGGGGGLGGGDTKCCAATVSYVCLTAFAPGNYEVVTFNFQVCSDGKHTYLSQGPSSVCTTQTCTPGQSWMSGGTCAPVGGVVLIDELLAMVPGGPNSHCTLAIGGGGGGGNGTCPPGYFQHPVYPHLCCSEPWQQVANPDGSTRWICTGTVVNTKSGGTAGPATASVGCANCGGIANSTYAPPNPSCGCHDTPDSAAAVEFPGALANGQIAGGTGLGGVGLLGMLLSQVQTTPQVKASADLTAQNAVGAITSLVVGAADGSFTVGGRITVTAIAGSNIRLQATWTDETGTSRTANFGAVLTTTGVSSDAAICIRAQTGTTITLNTSGVIGTITFNAGGEIIQTR